MTNIQISKENHERIQAIGRMGETYNDMVTKLLDCFEKRCRDRDQH